MDLSNYVTVLPIVVICYLAGIGCKAWSKTPDKLIPVIVGVLGGVIAIPATDIITAISIGIMSGLASTGVNQIYKQIKDN